MCDERTLEDAIAQARAGDRAALETLYARYAERLERRVEARMGVELRTRLEPRDVVQETFAQALASLERFEWRGEGSFFRWLSAVAENVLRMAAREKRRRPAIRLEDDVVRGSATASKAAVREERFARLQSAFDALTPAQREVLHLMRIRGLQIREIAARLGRSEGAVKQLAFRGLAALRERLGETDSFGLPDRSLDAGGERSDAD